MYSQKQKSTALEVFHQTDSVSETIRILGYPTRRQLNRWIAAEENMVKRERKQLPRFANPPDHPRNPQLDVKLDALKTKYSLPRLLEKLNLSKSSYYYQEKVLSQPDKYFFLRIRIRELFTENKSRYGYRRIHALLKREDIIVSEKIVRRIMDENRMHIL